MKRAALVFGLLAIAALTPLFLLLTPAAANAQTTPVFDSGSTAANYFFAPSAIESTARGWVHNAQDAANSVLRTLFIFEIIVIGVQAILFKDDLRAFFASFSFKIFTLSFFLWLIPNAGMVFPSILRTFGTLGQNVAVSGGVGTSSAGDALGTFFASGSTLALAYLGAADHLHSQVKIEAETEARTHISAMPNTVLGQAAPVALLAALGMMTLGCMAVLFMTWVMIVCEASIVMFGGVLFLGFAATRFTMPFTQGYLNYAVNIGVKYFTFWLVLAVEVHLLPSLVTSSIAGMLTSAALKYLTGTVFVSLLPLAYPMLSMSVMSAIAYGIPALSGSFISGNSAFSATQSVGNAMTAVTQTSSMLGRLSLSGERLLFQPGTLASKRAGAPGSKLSDAPQPPTPVMAPPTASGLVMPASSAHTTAVIAPILVASRSVGPAIAPAAPSESPPSDDQSLAGVSAAEIQALSDRAFFKRLIKTENVQSLNPAQQQATSQMLHKKDGFGKKPIFKDYVRYREKQERRTKGEKLYDDALAASSAERALLPQDDHGSGTGGMRWGSAKIGPKQ